MKKIILLLLPFLYIQLAHGQRYYKLTQQYDSVALRKLILTHTTEGTVTDSVLTKKANGGVYRVARSSFVSIESDPIWTSQKSLYNTKTVADGLYKPIGYVPLFSDILNKPTTLSGYGIVDAYPLSNPNGYTNNTGTVQSFNKIDGFGIISSVSSQTVNPVHTIATDTTQIRTVTNSFNKAQTNIQVANYITSNNATYPVQSGGETLNSVTTRNSVTNNGIIISKLGINAAANASKEFVFYSANIPRWDFQSDNSPESSPANGSDFKIVSFNNDGTVRDVPFAISRATSKVTFTSSVSIGSAPVNPSDGVRKIELDLKAPIISPNFTGIPTVPTAPIGTSTTQIASTAYVMNYATSLIATDTTNTPYTKATLNTTYPTAPIRFKAVCTNLGMVYEKYDLSNWIAYIITVLP